MKTNEMNGKDLVIVILLMPLMYLYDGFIFMKLWNWFITDVTNVTLTLPVAIGLAFFKGYVLPGKSKNYTESSSLWKDLLSGILTASLFLFFGFLLQLFI